MVSVRFNKQIYSPKAIRQAIKTYKSFARFSLRQDGRYYYKLTMDNIDPDFKDTLKDEFTNYILVLTKDAS